MLKKWVLFILSASVLVGAFSGCATQEQAEKTVVKILYSNKFEQVEKLVEATYSDIDLQPEESPYPSEQLRRLEKGIGPDLIMAPQINSALVEDYMLDISDTKASTAYDGTVMNSAKLNGKTYFIPFPGTYNGYIVNETLFDQAGLALPTTNKELVSTLSAMKQMGIGIGEDKINFSLTSEYNTSVGLFYVGCMVPDFLGTVEGVNWLADFKDKEATFAGVWEKSFDLSNSLAKAEVMDEAAIARQRNSISCENRMTNGTLAVAFGNTSLYYKCVENNKKAVRNGTAEKYSYKMLPFLSDNGNEPWFLFSPSALIGINKSISEEKQDACKRVLDLLSTPQGQEALIKDIEAGVSCLIGYEQQENLIPNGVEEYVQKGYVYNVLFPGKTVESLGGNARKVMAKKFTIEEALKAVDDFYYSGTNETEYDFTVVGTIGQDMLFENYNVRRGETEIGNFIADCVAEASGAQIAVVNGGGIRASFYKGVVYGGDLAAVCPFEDPIVVIEADGQTLWDMLENGLTVCTDDFPGGRFLQVSGLCYTFDSSKPAGSRLTSVTLPDKTAIDKSASYTIAITDYMAGSRGYAEGNGDGYTMLNIYDEATPKGNVELVKETDMLYSGAIAAYFEKHSNSKAESKIEGRIVDLAKVD